MNGAERILHAIGAIDQRYVEESEGYSKRAALRKRAALISGVAAAVALVAGGTILLQNRLKPEQQVPVSDASSCVSEVWVIPKWDEMSMAEKFGEAEFGGERYNASSIPGFERGEYLGTAELSGYDVYEEKSYTAKASVYSAVGISTQCAVVVAFDSGEEYVYRNTWYKPATLGEFISDLNLRENLEIAGALVQQNRADGWTDSYYTGISTAKVMEIIFADESIANVENFDQMVFEFGSSKIDFAVNVEKIGAQNISITLTEDGWLTTNILDTGKAFYVGTQTLEEALRYLENCECETKSYTYQIEDSDAQNEEISIEFSPAYQPE